MCVYIYIDEIRAKRAFEDAERGAIEIYCVRSPAARGQARPGRVIQKRFFIHFFEYHDCAARTRGAFVPDKVQISVK